MASEKIFFWLYWVLRSVYFDYDNKMEVLRLEYKLEVIILSEIDILSKSEIVKWYEFTWLALFTILKNRDKR